MMNTMQKHGTLRIHLPLWKHKTLLMTSRKGSQNRCQLDTLNPTSQGFLGYVFETHHFPSNRNYGLNSRIVSSADVFNRQPISKEKSRLHPLGLWIMKPPSSGGKRIPALLRYVDSLGKTARSQTRKVEQLLVGYI